MNITKVIAGLLVAIPVAVFAFVDTGGEPLLSNTAMAGYGPVKVAICHKDKNTLFVAPQALSAHILHGDKTGPCGAGDSVVGETAVVGKKDGGTEVCHNSDFVQVSLNIASSILGTNFGGDKDACE